MAAEIFREENSIVLAAAEKMVSLGSEASQRIINGMSCDKQDKQAQTILSLLTAYNQKVNLTTDDVESILYDLRELSEDSTFPTINPIVGQDLVYLVEAETGGGSGTFQILNNYSLLPDRGVLNFYGLLRAVDDGSRINVNITPGPDGYVIKMVSGAPAWANVSLNNGSGTTWNTVTNAVDLGGTLTGSTTVHAAGNPLIFNASSSALSNTAYFRLSTSANLKTAEVKSFSSGSNFGSVSTGTDSVTNATTMQFSVRLTGVNKTIDMSSSVLGISVLDAISSTGLFYSADYSTNGISNAGLRWIPDAGYVQGLTGSTGAWKLASGGILTNINTITANTTRWLNFTGTWTAAANNDFHTNFTGSFTGRAGQAADVLNGYSFAPTLTTGTNGQTLNAVLINPTFAGTGTFNSLGVYGNEAIFNNQAVAVSAATQKSSSYKVFQTNLWSGAVATTGWGVIRMVAGNGTDLAGGFTTNQLQGMAFYANVGSSPAFTGLLMLLNSSGSIHIPGNSISLAGSGNLSDGVQLQSSGSNFNIVNYNGPINFSATGSTTQYSVTTNGLYALANGTLATTTGTQKLSQALSFQTSLWTGAAEQKGWFSWRADASGSVNQLQYLTLYQSSGASPAFTNKIAQFSYNTTATETMALHTPSQVPFTMGIYNDTFSTTTSVFNFYANDGGAFSMGTNSPGKSLSMYVGSYATTAFTLNTTPSSSSMGFTWTATANNDFHFNFTGTFTSRNTASDTLVGYKFTPALTVNALAPAGQTLTALLLNPTFTGTATNKYILHAQAGGVTKAQLWDDGSLQLSQAAGSMWFGFIGASMSFTPNGRINRSGGTISLEVDSAQFIGMSRGGASPTFDAVSMFQMFGAYSTSQNGSNASATGNQVGSYEQHFKSSLWTGSAEIKGWYSWRTDASITVNQARTLSLYTSTGSSPSFGTPLLQIVQNGDIVGTTKFSVGTIGGVEQGFKLGGGGMQLGSIGSGGGGGVGVIDFMDNNGGTTYARFSPNGTVGLGSYAFNTSTITNATFYVLQGAFGSGWKPLLRLDPSANTAMTASTEFILYDFRGATWTWAANSGGFPTQRFTYFRAMTMATGVAADAYNVYIDACVGGTANWALGLNGKLKFVAIPTNDNAQVNLLTVDGTSGEVKYRTVASLPGGGGITNSAVSTELMMSNGTNAISSNIFVAAATAFITMGSSSLAGVRNLIVDTSDASGSLNLKVKAAGAFNFFSSTAGNNVTVSVLDGDMGFAKGGSTATTFTRIRIQKGRGNVSGYTTIINGDTVGMISFDGFDGSGAQSGVIIKAISNGTVASGSVPADLLLMTGTGNTGDANTLERLRIRSDGKFGFLTGATVNVDFDFNGGIAIRQSSPGAINADQNDYAIGAGTSFRLNPTTSARTITGLTGGFDGKILVIRNVGSVNLLLAHENASSSAANRITCSTAASITVLPNGVVTLQYDATASRWFDIALR